VGTQDSVFKNRTIWEQYGVFAAIWPGFDRSVHDQRRRSFADKPFSSRASNRNTCFGLGKPPSADMDETAL